AADVVVGRNTIRVVSGRAPPPSPSPFDPTTQITPKPGGANVFFLAPATTGENGGFVAAEK
ncbi:hypothetical protein, partial [Escherichia coli]|uniref:hypothetical protein n=1 Tax=Escherichia coli TaxID=562 RepID=UPI001BC8A423